MKACLNISLNSFVISCLDFLFPSIPFVSFTLCAFKIPGRPREGGQEEVSFHGKQEREGSRHATVSIPTFVLAKAGLLCSVCFAPFVRISLIYFAEKLLEDQEKVEEGE